MAKSNKNEPEIVQEGDLLPQKEYADTLAGLKNLFGYIPKQVEESGICQRRKPQI